MFVHIRDVELESSDCKELYGVELKGFGGKNEFCNDQ
jgi:hypothetical protein